VEKKGGVCAIVDKRIPTLQLDISSDYDDLEVVGFDLVGVVPVVRIIVLYRPPYYDTNAKQLVNKLIDFLTKYATDSSKHHVLVGDLNLPHIDWKHLTCSADYIHSIVFDFIIKYGFCQLVTFGTRQDNLLDVVLSDDELLIASVAPQPPIGHSDHLVIEFVIAVSMYTTCSSPISD